MNSRTYITFSKSRLRLQKILKMSTPPKLQMSDIPQELIDQLKDLVRLELKQEIKQEIKQEVMEEVRVELQKKEPPRGKCDADAQRFCSRGWG